MRFANVSGRAALLIGDGAVDVEKASDGRFRADPQAVYEVWDEFRTWAAGVGAEEAIPFDAGSLEAPAPAPAQVFAIGLNYSDHAAESDFEAPSQFPPVFTKFRTSLAGACTTVELPPGGKVDWEVELVAVLGRRAHRVSADEAWSCVAGLAVGQDISERVSQLAGPAPQFSLGKSFPGFAPFGPWLVTVDEFDDPDDIEIGCSLDGEVLQHGRTGDLLFSVPRLIEGLSRVTPLLPGDVIFTGTPSGVGLGRVPQRFLQPGDELVSFARGIGELRQRFVQA
ncbi:fumarylacetoacetate hydrolase family protein [Amycolatopsis rhizosphaerae]|uniref:Fumarylacetoacetate hydrolase family protein n=1 Tax=Amycolatopsis rhizosphaerae TaxID=2053003 RepID=A0A558DGT5_9PSEU|nr:fumarylacetoacetate hydrolase family protein [Amycolatopsis rhizosphaerae]TVT60219.1 fumarylacetoacetate hydrolase family protein [Amycolatopsis rhizosphaerae]